MNKGTYVNVLDTILKEQVEIIQSKKIDNDFDAVNSTCLTNIMYLMAHLTDEVSSVADEIKSLKEEISDAKQQNIKEDISEHQQTIEKLK